MTTRSWLRPLGLWLMTLVAAVTLLALGYNLSQSNWEPRFWDAGSQLAGEASRANRLAALNQRLEARLAQAEARGGGGVEALAPAQPPLPGRASAPPPAPSEGWVRRPWTLPPRLAGAQGPEAQGRPEAPPQAAQGERSGHQPPPHAYEECRSKRAGDLVQHGKREGFVPATCVESPQGLVARPNQHGDTQQKVQQQKQPPRGKRNGDVKS